MLLIKCFAAALAVAFPVFAASSSSQDKIARLESLRSSYEPIRLDAKKYDELTSKPRNYSLFITLTAAASQYKCQPCWEWAKEYNLIVAAENRVHEPGSIYFANLDFSDAQEIFQRLQIYNIPLVHYFPPTDGEHTSDGAPEKYDLNRKGIDAESFAAYIEAVCNVKLTITRPFNWQWYGFLTLTFLALVALVRMALPYILVVVTNKSLWTIGTIGATLIFCGGHMWNQIRGAPYAGSKPGDIIAGGFGNQFAIETQIMAFLYAVTGFSLVFLVQKPKTVQNEFMKRVTAYGGVALFWMMFAMITKVFKSKLGGYPYALPPFN